MLAPVTLGFYGSCRKMAEIFLFIFWNDGSWGWWTFPLQQLIWRCCWELESIQMVLALTTVALPCGCQLLHSTLLDCWKNHSSLKALPNHRKEGKPQALVRTLQFAEHISKHIASVTVWESDEVSNLFTGRTPLVEDEGEVVCLAIWYFSSPSLCSSLQACFYMWPCSIIIMLLGEHEHFFWLHLFFSPPTHPRWSGSWTEWEQCENECRENVWLSSSAGSCWVERQLFFSHTLALDRCSLGDENRPFMGGAVQQGEGAAHYFQQNVYLVEEEVSPPSLLKMLLMKAKEHWTRKT